VGSKRALILVDLQNDFCAGGSLEVPYGDEVIAIANRLQPLFDLVIATKDFHPADHTSFASNHSAKVGEVMHLGEINQILWPDHCVQGTRGAEFHPGLDIQFIHKIIFKGTDKNIDSYSAFFDNAHLRHTELQDYLHKENIKEVYIMGLATDYCVKFSCFDAIQLGFKTVVIVDGCRGVELKAGDSENAFKEMRARGAVLLTSDQLSMEKLCE